MEAAQKLHICCCSVTGPGQSSEARVVASAVEGGGGCPAQSRAGVRRETHARRRALRAFGGSQARPQGSLARTFTTPGTPAANVVMIAYTSSFVLGTTSNE